MVYLIVATLVLLALLLGLLWAAGGVQRPGLRTGEIRRFELPAKKSVGSGALELKIVSWNIAYGHGLGSAGPQYKRIHHSAAAEKLDAIAETIRQADADFILLQEVDWASRRSHFRDQVAFLAQTCRYPFAAVAESWSARYVPYPYWDWREHFGKIRSGGVILSRYPITENEVTLFEKPAEQRWWVRWFYLFRYLQIARIQLNDEQAVSLANLHLDAFFQSSRVRQARAACELLRTAAQQGRAPLVIAGDLNSVHPLAAAKSGFQDEPQADFAHDDTVKQFLELPGYREALAVESLTFPSDHPTRRLDYIFARTDAELLSAEVLPAGKASDHLPIQVKIRLHL